MPQELEEEKTQACEMMLPYLCRERDEDTDNEISDEGG